MILDLFQKRIDDASRAFMTGDFDAYMSVVDTPLVLLTESETVVLSAEAEFRQGFDTYVAFLRAEKATDLMRLGYSVTECSPGLMTGRYETHILRHGQRIYGPFQSSLSMRQLDTGVWKITSVVSPTKGERWPGYRPRRAVQAQTAERT